MKKNTVTIVGSFNVDLISNGERIPKLGETVIGDEFSESAGGKGSNQAISARTFGAETNFVARVGNDKYGQNALNVYQKLGVNTNNVYVDKTVHSGIAMILVDKEGNNLISVIPGANYHLSKDDIDQAEEVFKQSSIVGFQLENRFDVIEYAIKKVHSLGVKTLLDPAPAIKLPEDLYQYIDIIKPNETESEILSGIKVADVDSAKKAADWFMDKGVKNVIITLGGKGGVFTAEDKVKSFESVKVTPLDTTGAGDVFNGALMANLSQGKLIEDAINFANHAAALSVTKPGVFEAVPTLEEVEFFMNK